MMSFNKKTQFNRGRKPTKRVLIGEIFSLAGDPMSANGI